MSHSNKLMKSFSKIFVVLIFLGLLLPVFGFAQSPGIPHKFYGTVVFSEGATADGLMVEAKVDGAVIGTSATNDGKYGYLPDLLFATDSNSTNAGKTVEFYVSGIRANETAVFVNGRSTNLNLTVSGVAETPEPEPEPEPAPVSGGPTGGGSWYTSSSVTQSPSVSLSQEAQAVDSNDDNKIDVLDFNLLMVNWGGDEINNVADFNNDNKVDVLDFNLVMVHWTV